MPNDDPGYLKAMDLFEEHRAEWLAEARRRIEAYASDGRTVTINDVINLGPPVPDGYDPRVRAGVFTNRSVWESLGYGPNPRRECNGRPICRFRLKGA